MNRSSGATGDHRAAALIPLAIGVLASGCATVVVGHPTTDPSEVQAALALPPGRGAAPTGTDRHGFLLAAARCLGTDQPVILISGGLANDPYRFAVCRNDSGVRTLRAWASPEPTEGNINPGYIAMAGTFFTDTPNSSQFIAGDAKIDIGPSVVTVQWPTRNRITRSTSYPIISRWDRQ